MPEPIPQYTLYRNGNIYTMEDKDDQGKSKKVECLVVGTPELGGKIEYAGSEDGLPSYIKSNRHEVDLEGKTLMPGFIDPHVHPSMAGILLNTKFITPCDWNLPRQKVEATTTPKDYEDKLKDWIEKENMKKDAQPDKFLITWGYISQFHGKNICRNYLDELCSQLGCKRPVIVWQRSFHELYMNTRALDLCWGTNHGKHQDTEWTLTPLEDVMKHDQVDWEKGQFFEGGLDLLLSGSKFNDVTGIMTTLGAGYKDMIKMAEKAGITTIADLEFPALELKLEAKLGKDILEPSCEDDGPSFTTFAVPSARQFGRFSHVKGISQIKFEAPRISGKKFIMYDNRVKFMNDGAFFSQAMQMVGGYTDDTEDNPHKGQWITPIDEMKVMFKTYWDAGFQIHLHTNGDDGMNNLLDNVEQMLKSDDEDNKKSRLDTHRTVVEHAGFFTEEQAKRLADTKCLVSAQPFYNYILADKYSQTMEDDKVDGGLGDRGQCMTPLQHLVNNGVPFALHSDLTMAPAEPLLLAWCAITRKTISGEVTSEDQCISVWDGMKGITSNAALILGQLDSMGTLTVGKLGNLTCLTSDPFDYNNKETLNEIKVYGTVFQGGKLKKLLNCDESCQLVHKLCKNCRAPEKAC